MRTCCNYCKSVDLAHERYGGNLFDTSPVDLSDADDLLGPDKIHWVLSNEVYIHPKKRRDNIGGWFKDSFIDGPNLVLYNNGKCAILACRGSVTTSDIADDVRISKPHASTCAFDRVEPAIKLLKEFMSSYNVQVQTTGHSLGGSVAKSVGEHFGLYVVTFNTAAPPSNPPTNGKRQRHYHIVFDPISAWIPSLRIDKGIRPHHCGMSRYVSEIPGVKSLLVSGCINPILKAHSISMFSKTKMGRITSSTVEEAIWQTWFSSLPRPLRNAFLNFIDTREIPSIP